MQRPYDPVSKALDVDRHLFVDLLAPGGNALLVLYEAIYGLLAKVAERDAEISTLRGQLEDKERMITALTAARKRNDTAHEVGSDGSPGSRRTSSYQRSEGSSVNILHAKGPTSPVSPNRTFFPPAPTNAGKNIEEMTRMLDEMITGRVDRAARRSRMPVTEVRRT